MPNAPCISPAFSNRKAVASDNLYFLQICNVIKQTTLSLTLNFDDHVLSITSTGAQGKSIDNQNYFLSIKTLQCNLVLFKVNVYQLFLTF
jgi:hypothetical protein